MSNQLAGFPAFGNRIDSPIVYNPRIVTYDPAIALPTSEPADNAAQMQITIAVGDLPVHQIPFASDASVGGSHNIWTILGFKNTGAGAANISVKAKTASAPTFYILSSTGNTIGAGKYKTCFYSMVQSGWGIGSVHEAKIWSSAEGVEFRWAAMIITPRRLGSGLLGAALLNLEIAFSNASIIGASSCTNIHSSSVVAPRMFIRRSQVGTTSGGGFEYDTFGYLAFLSLPCYPMPTDNDKYDYEFLVGTKTLADHGGVSANWAVDTSSESKYHLQPVYPTRVAFTPILL